MKKILFYTTIMYIIEKRRLIFVGLMLIATSIIILLQSCNQSQVDNLPEPIKKKLEEIEVKGKTLLTYRFLSMDSLRLLYKNKVLFSKHSSLIYALNKVDEQHLFRLDSVLLPDTIVDELIFYSPFQKQIKFLSPVRKLILFYYPLQSFAAYSNGRLIRWGPVSMGKKSTPTPAGLYFTNWKAKRTVSTVNDEWIMDWYFNLENQLGISMHEYDLPGYPASHSCIRMLESDAIWFYEWADQWTLTKDDRIASFGTPVVVFGEFPDLKVKPWLQLNNSKELIQVADSTFGYEIKKYSTIILERQSWNDSIHSQISLSKK